MRFIVLLLFACVFTQDLEVEGDLKVTGTIQNDSLMIIIADLQAQISALQVGRLTFYPNKNYKNNFLLIQGGI